MEQWREISTRRVEADPLSFSSLEETNVGDKWGGKGIVDRAVEISGRIIGVRLNWLDRGSRQMAVRENPMEKFLSLPQVDSLHFKQGRKFSACTSDYSRKTAIYAFFIHHRSFRPFSSSPFFLFLVDIWGEGKRKRKKGEKKGICSCILHGLRKNRPRI